MNGTTKTALTGSRKRKQTREEVHRVRANMSSNAVDDGEPCDTQSTPAEYGKGGVPVVKPEWMAAETEPKRPLDDRKLRVPTAADINGAATIQVQSVHHRIY